MGETSAEAIYSVGRSKAKLAELQTTLLNDRTGLEAAIYLGNVLGQIKNKTKTKPKSNAPAPAPNLGGGEISKTVNAASLKKMFLKADKAGDTTKAYELYSKGKKAGVDVEKWR